MRIFIACPNNIVTGGTELLHQFSKCLKDRNVECYMLYLGEKSLDCPVPEAFMKYEVKYVSQYVDAYDSILVLPETRVHLVSMCKKGIAMIWWLSVDFYISSFESLIKDDNKDIFALKSRKNVIHFVQSQYAKDFLQQEMGISEAYFLKDYINDEIMNFAKAYGDRVERTNYCLYNPMKGFNNLEPIINNCRSDITWVPLKGLKPHEMAAMMCRAKVYIDFGGHPGKDRIPREAAICGCCVITNKLGSATYQEDVSIPDKYKIGDMTNVENVLQVIYDCVDNYEQRKEEYQAYRDVISCEKEEFMRDVDKAIDRLAQVIDDREGNEMNLLSTEHIEMIDALKKFVGEIDARFELIKISAQ